MEQALLNILKNAVEAIDGEGTITVRLTSTGGRTTLTIEDTGPGITPRRSRTCSRRSSAPNRTVKGSA